MNDTSSTIKLRWEVTRVHVMEAEVPVDQIPDGLFETDEDSWSIVTGDVDSYEVIEFLSDLEDSGAAVERSADAESYVVLDDVELIAPVSVAAPPVHVEASVEVTEYVEMVAAETFTPYTADEVVDFTTDR